MLLFMSDVCCSDACTARCTCHKTVFMELIQKLEGKVRDQFVVLKIKAEDAFRSSLKSSYVKAFRLNRFSYL